MTRNATNGTANMKLEGIHHITAITADGQSNVDFYAGVLGLRLVKKTVNQDDISVYHLFFADEQGSAGSDITFFEFPGAPVGRAGAGMVHRIVWRLGAPEAPAFWAERLAEHGIDPSGDGERLRFADPEGLEHELRVVETEDEPLIADHPDIPRELALQGFDGARAYASEQAGSTLLLGEAMELQQVDEGWEARGERRGSTWSYDEPPAESGVQGAGTVHHIAWASEPKDHEGWRDRVVAAGLRPTPVIDRFYFRSVYFREPSGVLFEIATVGPGFTVDEPIDRLGEGLSLPPFLADRRQEIERGLHPVVGPRERARTTADA